MSKITALLIVVAILNLSITAPANSSSIRVIDGDTLVLNGNKIRLEGIDAPERNQMCQERYRGQWRCGMEATEFLQGFVQDKEVVCEQLGVDKYDRIIATCYANGENVNRALVANGFAIAYHIGGHKYKPAENAARTKSIGLWYGSFTKPSHWRRGKRVREERF